MTNSSTVAQLDSHDLATATRFLLREKLEWVADVIVPIEPFTGGRQSQ